MRFEIGRDEAGQALNRAHRRVFLLSGLLTCGGCGGGYTIIGKDRYGCATRRGRGTCENAVTITRQRIEARVLEALRDRLLTPARVEEFVRAFAEELVSQEKEAGTRRKHLERTLAETERGLQGLVRAIENGAWSETLQKRLAELETRKAAMIAELALLATAEPPATLHLNAAEIYAAAVADLEASLNDAEIRTEASEVLRGLIEKVSLTPDADAPDGLAAALHGDLAQVLALASPAATPTGGSKGAGMLARGRLGRCVPASQLSVVAGTGFEPVTFRL